MDTENGLDNSIMSYKNPFNSVKETVIPGPMVRYKIPAATFVLYYRNVPRDVVLVETGDYATLRKLEQEIRLIDPGNYLAIHELIPVTEDKIPEIVKELFDV